MADIDRGDVKSALTALLRSWEWGAEWANHIEKFEIPNHTAALEMRKLADRADELARRARAQAYYAEGK